MNKNAVLSLIVIVAILGAFLINKNDTPKAIVSTETQFSQVVPTPEISNNTQDMAKPEMTIDTTKDYSVVLKTNMGDITIKLFADKTPITVNNFVTLAEKSFYDGVIFHRVIPGFMIQGGDPTGTGMGGPGYQFEDEIVDGLEFTKAGLLAMANAGPGTNGSQFFITLGNTDWLNGNHTIFGEVVDGMDIVEKIGLVETNAQDKPLSPVIINSTEVLN